MNSYYSNTWNCNKCNASDHKVRHVPAKTGDRAAGVGDTITHIGKGIKHGTPMVKIDCPEHLSVSCLNCGYTEAYNVQGDYTAYKAPPSSCAAGMGGDGTGSTDDDDDDCDCF